MHDTLRSFYLKMKGILNVNHRLVTAFNLKGSRAVRKIYISGTLYNIRNTAVRESVLKQVLLWHLMLNYQIFKICIY